MKNLSTEARLEAARPFLRGDLAAVDPELPSFLSVLRSRGASECWHKHGTFLDHLFGVYRILKLWRAPDTVARCGLFHSAYSNSYVNLVIFQPGVERQVVSAITGRHAELLIHMFCIVPRHQLIHDMLLFRFTDDQLLSALHSPSLGSVDSSHAPSVSIPPEGITVKHIHTGECLQVPRKIIAIFLLLTMADFMDQHHGWQDELFDNHDGQMNWSGNTYTALWPGNGKPALLMTLISRMGVLLNLILREESKAKEIAEPIRENELSDMLNNLELEVPPLFNNCTTILSPENQIQARNLYWEVICSSPKEKASATMEENGAPEKKEYLEKAESLLQKACKLNPWIGEPHVVLAQVFLSQGKFEAAEREADEGLRILLEWGTNWDKRMPWEGWISWARVLLQKAEDKIWTSTSFGVLNLGLVS